jgi:DNA-binding response OmpR family regulator
VSRPSLDDCPLLLVEDDPLIALDIADTLRAAGARVFSAASVREALAMLDGLSLSAAVIDYRLGDGTADDLCERLTEMGIPFVIYSGCIEIEGACNKWGIISKPAAPATLVAMVVALLPAE